MPFACASAPVMPAISTPVHKVYAVVFQVQADRNGKILSLKVDHVFDPSLPGPPDEVARTAVDVPIPQDYLDAVRAFLDRRDYRDAPPTFYTYTYFDPSRPTDPDPPRP